MCTLGVHAGRVTPTLYKARGVPNKREVCAICVDRTRGRTEAVDLGRGVSVWLCPAHASSDFREQRNGRDFVLTLHRLWKAHGCLTKPRSRALDDHLEARKGTQRPARQLPGSYSWPSLRREAEHRFAAGAPPAVVIAELRARHRQDVARAPSVRTMRRWYREQRWLTNAPPEPADLPPEPASAGPSAVPVDRGGGGLANWPPHRRSIGQPPTAERNDPEPGASAPRPRPSERAPPAGG